MQLLIGAVGPLAARVDVDERDGARAAVALGAALLRLRFARSRGATGGASCWGTSLDERGAAVDDELEGRERAMSGIIRHSGDRYSAIGRRKPRRGMNRVSALHRRTEPENCASAQVRAVTAAYATRPSRRRSRPRSRRASARRCRRRCGIRTRARSASEKPFASSRCRVRSALARLPTPPTNAKPREAPTRSRAGRASGRASSRGIRRAGRPRAPTSSKSPATQRTPAMRPPRPTRPARRRR